jgi:hypothetical protein
MIVAMAVGISFSSPVFARMKDNPNFQYEGPTKTTPTATKGPTTPKTDKKTKSN